MYSYVAYGLGIRSALPLPELVEGEAAADVVLRFGSVNHPPAGVDIHGEGFWATATSACRFLPDVGAFLVRGGREIIVDPAPGAEERVLRLSILGPAIALLLHQRGRFVLHASAVEGGGGAVVFMGGSGSGKSTLAAALHGRGQGLVADDVTAIDVSAECSTVFPGFPQVKLWPEAAVSLGDAPEAWPRLHPLFEKRARSATRGFSHRPLPLKRIYVLAEGPIPTIEALPSAEGLIELVRHWYGSRFGDRLLRADGAATSHFQQCATLANRLPVHRLRRPRHVGAILDTARVVEDDLGQEFAHELGGRLSA